MPRTGGLIDPKPNPSGIWSSSSGIDVGFRLGACRRAGIDQPYSIIAIGAPNDKQAAIAGHIDRCIAIPIFQNFRVIESLREGIVENSQGFVKTNPVLWPVDSVLNPLRVSSAQQIRETHPFAGPGLTTWINQAARTVAPRTAACYPRCFAGQFVMPVLLLNRPLPRSADGLAVGDPMQRTVGRKC